MSGFGVIGNAGCPVLPVEDIGLDVTAVFGSPP
jgi:hypothetical protein